VQAIEGDRVVERPDRLVTEEPMEIRVHGPGQEPAPLAVTMRTPGNDFELAVGFCHSEGVLRSADDLAEVAYCLEGEGEQQYNVVTVRLRRPFDREAHQRNFVANASCGLCGKASLDQVETYADPVAPGPVVTSELLARLPVTLRGEQAVFDATGGLHAAALFDPDGSLLVLREDVGRHNALDKVIGHAVLERNLPLSGTVLLVSGRISFEIVQKAAVAGIPILCAVSAPSSLAVDAARRFNQTVVGFLREQRCNVYCGTERVQIGNGLARTEAG
jgi:FdhD protein